MSVYYISSCHDCQERVMWIKVERWKAEEWHEYFHKGHNTEFGDDFQDEFYDRVWTYENLGIKEGEEG